MYVRMMHVGWRFRHRRHRRHDPALDPIPKGQHIAYQQHVMHCKRHGPISTVLFSSANMRGRTRKWYSNPIWAHPSFCTFFCLYDVTSVHLWDWIWYTIKALTFCVPKIHRQGDPWLRCPCSGVTLSNEERFGITTLSLPEHLMQY